MNRQDLVQRQLEDAARKDPSISAEISSLRDSAQGLSLNSLLLTPMQRTIHYMLTIDRVRSHTNEEDKKATLMRMVSRVKAAVATMDTATAKMRKLRALVLRVQGLEWSELVKEGMSITNEETVLDKEGRTIQLFLLNDRLVMCADGASLQMKGCIPQHALRNASIRLTSSEQDTQTPVGFSICGEHCGSSSSPSKGGMSSSWQQLDWEFFHEEEHVCRQWVAQLKDLLPDPATAPSSLAQKVLSESFRISRPPQRSTGGSSTAVLSEGSPSGALSLVAPTASAARVAHAAPVNVAGAEKGACRFCMVS